MQAEPFRHHIHTVYPRPFPEHLLADGPASSVGEKLGRHQFSSPADPTSTPVLTSAPTLCLLSCDRAPLSVFPPFPSALGLTAPPRRLHAPMTTRLLSLRQMASTTLCVHHTHTNPRLSHACLQTPLLRRGSTGSHGRCPRPVCRIPSGPLWAGFHLGHPRDTALVATSSDLRVARASGRFSVTFHVLPLPCRAVSLSRLVSCYWPRVGSFGGPLSLVKSLNLSAPGLQPGASPSAATLSPPGASLASSKC